LYSPFRAASTKQKHLEFKKEVTNRRIEHLIHFTPTINLLSIFEQGKLLSRALLEKNDIDNTLLDFIEFLDNIRFDDKNYINLSLTSPNYFLFNRFRERTKDKPFRLFQVSLHQFRKGTCLVCRLKVKKVSLLLLSLMYKVAVFRLI